MSEPKRLGVASAKQQLLRLVDELPEDGVLLTKRGKVVARLTPMRPSTLSMFGALRNSVKILGDTVETSDLTAEYAWTADADNLPAAVKRRKVSTKKTTTTKTR